MISLHLPRELRTERMWLRRWRPEDRGPFARLNADPRVVEFLRGALSREESDALADRIEAHFERHGYGLWAVEIPGVTPFAGFVGLSIASFEAPFTPCVEVGWRLAAEYWNCGYATEGARAALEFGFVSLQLEEIVSFTAAGNVRSRRVMEKIGMTHSASDDFDHPLLPEGHPLRRHVLYRAARPNSVERSYGEIAMSFTIREATAADIPALADLHVRTWNATYPDYPKKPTHEIRERQWREAFEVTDGSWFCFVVEGPDGELVGFAKGVPYDHEDLPDFAGELSKIYLLRGYQRQGPGRRLVGHVARRFLSQGISSMVLFAEPNNPSCRFYEALEAERLLDRKGNFHGGYGWRDLERLTVLCPIE